MNAFNIATKAASALALVSVATEAHEMAKRNSRRNFAQASADKFVKDSIGASKMNTESSRHASVKDFIENNDLTDRAVELGGGIGGYLTGIGKCLKRNAFTVGFGIMGLAVKSKPAKIIALTGMGISMLCDTIFNATNLFERTDYLDN